MRTRKSFLKDLCAGTIATFFFPSIIKAFNQDGPLKSPSNVKAEAGSGSHFIVTWQADPDNKQKFRIERRMDNEQWENAGVAGTDMTRYLSAGCFANTSYDHRVVAFNDTSEAISEIVSGTTPDKLPDRRGGIIETSSARQGEGTFLKLKNGNLELYYSDMETVSDLAEAQVSKVVSSDGGKTWGERQVVFKEKGFALFLPGAVRLPNGNIGITYAHRIPGQWYSKRVFRYSTDEGNIWSDEIQVSDDTYNYSTGSHDRIYHLSNGDIMILVHSLSGDEKIRPRHLVTDVYLSPDNGLNWNKMAQESLDVPYNPYMKGEYGLWECAIAELGGGKIVMLGRTATTWLYGCESYDYGRSWTQPEKIDIPQPLSPPYIKQIPGTNLILFLNNPIIEKDHRLLGNRYVLASRISDDGGKTWKKYKQVEYHSHDWWYDYPNVLFDGEDVHISMRDIKLTPQNSWDKVYLGYLKLSKGWFVQ